MSVELVIREAALADAAAFDSLLAECGLSSYGVLAPGTRYWLAERSGEVIGVVGLEYGAALLDAPQVRHYDEQGWLPDEVAWCKDLSQEAH